MRWWLPLISVSALLGAPAFGTTWRVTPDGTGDYPTIQAAIDAAQPGDVIELAAGTFTGEGNRAVSFRGKAVTVRSQNGNPQMCRIDCQSAARGFLFTLGEGSESVLEGVTIVNGLANEGGAVICNDSSPRISRCIFFRNRAHWNAGALKCMHAHPALADCRFEENRAEIFGGAIFGSAECHPDFTDCTFLANTVGQGGGAASFDLATRATFTRCRVERNVAATCGGGIMSWCATLDLTDCGFFDNDAGTFGMGGGLYDGGTGSGGTLTGCTFSGNRAELYGGGMYHEGTQVTLTHCTFHGNASPLGGGLFCYNPWPDPTVTVTNAIFSFSTEGEGVRAWNATSVPALTCCDIYGNAGGDWVGPIAPQAGVHGNLSADPLYCDVSRGDFRLSATSPCVTRGELAHCGGGFLGAWEIGCGLARGAFRHELAAAERGGGISVVAWPNPFRGACRFTIAAPAPGDVAVRIFDPAGRQVRCLAMQAAGACWDGRDDAGRELPSGAYRVRVETPEGSRALPILRLR